MVRKSLDVTTICLDQLSFPFLFKECPLNCAPGRCIFSGYPQRPYACLWNGVMRPLDGTTG